MTSFQPPYLAEEIVLLPQHLDLGLLPGDDLVLGQVAGPRPAGLVGEGLPRLRLVEPIVGRLHRGFPADDPPRDVVGVEYLERALPPFSFIDEDLHEGRRIPHALLRDGFHVGARSYQGDLFFRIGLPGHKETSDSSVTGGNLLGSPFF